MTTITVRDRIMAADSQGTTGNIRSRVEKMWRIGDQAILGVAGTLADCMVFRQWAIDSLLEDCEDAPPKMDEVEAIVLTRKGVYHYSASPIPTKIGDKFYAIGSGAELALGAMQMGADARQAVRVASKWDVHTGGRISTLSLDKMVKLK